jgi:hypothetical protein
MINFSLLDEAFPNDDRTIKKQKKKESECKPIQAPIYTIPLACDNDKKYQDMINISSKKEAIDHTKDGIKAFDFDEMDAYLNIADIKNINPKKEENTTTPDLETYLKSFKENFKNKPEIIEHFTNNELKVDINLYNLFLFIFLGIIIILLIDQITKLVINS